jgi:hypothetical protein
MSHSREYTGTVSKIGQSLYERDYVTLRRGTVLCTKVHWKTSLAPRTLVTRRICMGIRGFLVSKIIPGEDSKEECFEAKPVSKFTI